MLLFQMKVSACEEERETAFVQYMDVTLPRDRVNRALRRVSLWWSTEIDTNCTFAQKIKPLVRSS